MQPYSPLNSILALPVDRLVRVEVAGVQERAFDLEDAADAAVASQRTTAWPPGKNGNSDEQRTNTSGWLATAAMIALVGVEVDAERLLAEQVLAGLDDVDVQLGVQVVGHGAVDRVDVRVVEQLALVGRRAAASGSSRSYQASTPGWCRRRATISGRTSRSARCSQRAAADANSRPIRPQPMMPKRTTRPHRACARRHQRARHAARVGVLDDVAAVDDAGGALLHQRPRCARASRRRRPAAAAHEHRRAAAASTTCGTPSRRRSGRP